jgi:hypothetical protein
MCHKQGSGRGRRLSEAPHGAMLEKRRGDLPIGISPPLTEFPEDPASATRSQLCSPGVLFQTAGSTPRYPDDSCDPRRCKNFLAASEDFQFPGSSMSLVADTREAAGLLSSGKIALPLPMIMARDSAGSSGLFVCKSRTRCGNGGGKSGHATKGKRMKLRRWTGRSCAAPATERG